MKRSMMRSVGIVSVGAWAVLAACSGDSPARPEEAQVSDASVASGGREGTKGPIGPETQESGPGSGQGPVSVTVGKACASDQDCAGGVCLKGDQAWWSSPFSGGYCSVLACDAGVCPSGSDCFVVDKSTNAKACLAACTGASDCRAGQDCFQPGACLPSASAAPPPLGKGSPVGGPCTADADCAGTGASCIREHNGEFAGGYCLIRGCTDTAPCPAGSACFSISDTETACLPTCDASQSSGCRSDYLCSDPGVCLPKCTPTSCEAGEACMPDGTCARQACTATSCSAGLVCDSTSGSCVPEGAPSLGRVPSCNALPDWHCTGGESYCGTLIPFDPDLGRGYWDYPINGETETNQYRSFIRRDVMMLVKYASAAVDCLAAGWSFGDHKVLGLGDMSESNGAIPGTSIGAPGHPAGTHVFGHDMDIAYFQLNSPDNKLREICPHTRNGQDQLHCVAPPDNLDVWRTALFIGKIHDSSQLRVIGCDGQVGPLLEAATEELCRTGWLTGNACRNLKLTYEVTDEGRGWFLFHLHHFHISLVGQGANAELPGTSGRDACLSPDCTAKRHDVGPVEAISPLRRPARVSFPK